MIKIACLSDTHCQLERIEIPPCDVILHAGDFSYRGEMPEVIKELEILSHKADYINADVIIVPGNHDWVFQYHSEDMKKVCRKLGIHLLIHEAMILKMGEKDYKVFGSPWTPYFFNWAFNAGRTVNEAAHYFKPFIGDLWKDIPDDTNILITHGGPYKILDNIPDSYIKPGSPNTQVNVGCEELLKKVNTLDSLKLHVYGHIHNAYNKVVIDGKTFVNASNCTEQYKPYNPVIVVNI